MGIRRETVRKMRMKEEVASEETESDEFCDPAGKHLGQAGDRQR